MRNDEFRRMIDEWVKKSEIPIMLRRGLRLRGTSAGKKTPFVIPAKTPKNSKLFYQGINP